MCAQSNRIVFPMVSLGGLQLSLRVKPLMQHDMPLQESLGSSCSGATSSRYASSQSSDCALHHGLTLSEMQQPSLSPATAPTMQQQNGIVTAKRSAMLRVKLGKLLNMLNALFYMKSSKNQISTLTFMLFQQIERRIYFIFFTNCHFKRCQTCFYQYIG